MRYWACLSIPALMLLVTPALAQTTEGDPGQGTGPLPTNVAKTPAPICADRPTKNTGACTVPAGTFQLESDFIDWTRMSDAGMRTDTILYTNPTLKYGLGTHLDVEVNIAPYETVRTTMGGVTDTERGIGDLYLRLKERLTPDAAKTQIALIPFVKAPTAKDTVGNGHWEGGLIAAANIPLPAHFTVTVNPEVEVLANDSGDGYHVGLVGIVNLSHPVGKKVNLYAEFWNEQELAPGGTVHQYSLDYAATYQLDKKLQLDAGINVGLNRSTPDHEIYVGISKRF